MFVPEEQHGSMASLAQLPTVDKIRDDLARVYYSTRDELGRSLTKYVELDANDPQRTRYVHHKPVLELGELGSFDDRGAMGSCIVESEGVKYLYYIGWNTSTTVPYRLAIGLAASQDGGRTFLRRHPGPILDRTRSEPHFCTTPCVIIDRGKWRMWYTSCVAWEAVHHVPEPRYHVKYAESDDGVDWERKGTVCIECDESREAIARPWVLKTGDTYRMWYCHRRISAYRTERLASYRIGYAESADGIRWRLKDGVAGLDVCEHGWDAEMTAYPCVYRHRGRTYMFYNGNGFGRSGFGYAVWHEETGKSHG